MLLTVEAFTNRTGEHMRHTVWRLTASLVLTALLTTMSAAQSFAEPATTDDPAELASAEAATTGIPVEVEEWTKENSVTVANPDGTFTLESSRDAVRARTDDGTWAPIDTAIAASGDRLAPKLTPTKMDFSAGGDNVLAATHVDGESLSIETPFDLPTPTVDDASITYPNVMPDIDLVVSVTADAYSHVLVVKNAAAAANPDLHTLPFTVVTTDGLDYTVNEDGSSQATDTEGDTVLESSAPYLWDSTPITPNGEAPSAQSPGGNVSEVPLIQEPQKAARSLASGDSGRTEVTLTPPPEALLGADVTYPVFVDPPMQRPRLSFVVTREGMTSYVSNDDFRIGYCPATACTPAYRARTYFNFDISSLKQQPGGNIGVVTSAKITMQVKEQSGAAPTPIMLSRTTSTFGGWTAYPGPLGSELVTVTPNADGNPNLTFASADLTAWVASLVYQQNTTAGFALRAVNESDPGARKTFNNSPTLTLTYGFASSVPTGLGLTQSMFCQNTRFATSNQPTFAAKARTWDPAGSLVRVRFTVYNKATGASVGTYVSKDVGSNATATATTPVLPQGHYYVKAQSEPVYTDVPAADFRSSFTGGVDFTVATQPVGTANLWSSTHPMWLTQGPDPVKPNFSSNRPGVINLAAGNDTIGFYYAWNKDAAPANNIAQCTDPSTNNSLSGFVKGDLGRATLEIPGSLAAGGTATLVVKVLGRNGAQSAEVKKSLQLNATNTTVMAIEAQAAVKSYAGGATGQITNDSLASAGSKLTVTSPAGGSVTFKFTPTAATTVLQPDLNLPSGKSANLALNGNTLLKRAANEVMPDKYECVPATISGTGTLSYPQAELVQCTGEGVTSPAVNPGVENTFTITTPVATTYTIDLMRVVDE